MKTNQYLEETKINLPCDLLVKKYLFLSVSKNFEDFCFIRLNSLDCCMAYN